MATARPDEVAISPPLGETTTEAIGIGQAGGGAEIARAGEDLERPGDVEQQRLLEGDEDDVAHGRARGGLAENEGIMSFLPNAVSGKVATLARPERRTSGARFCHALRDIVVLAAGQALTGTVTSLLTSVSSLSGAYLAPAPSLSTLPVTATVLGTLLMIYPASALMGRLGRRGGFMFKAGIGVIGGAVCCLGLMAANFAILIVGTFLLGIFSAFGQYYRFAAIDAARSPQGTHLCRRHRHRRRRGRRRGRTVSRRPFRRYRRRGALCRRVRRAFRRLRLLWRRPSSCFPPISDAMSRGTEARAAAASFTLNVGFLKASAICAIGFAVMTLTMNAAPLSLHQCGFSLPASSMVLQVHFALMYLPSFVQSRAWCRGLDCAA